MSSIKNKIINLNLHNDNDRVLDFSDFQKQTIQFDIDKLQDAYNQIVKIKKFEDAGVTNFGAISLTQIPGDPDSIKGNKARGVYWTKPDKSGKEVSRDVNVLMNQNILNLSRIMKILILKRFMIFSLQNISWEELEYY